MVKSPTFGFILRQAQDEVEHFNGLNLMVNLSRFVGLTVGPWAASFLSCLLGAAGWPAPGSFGFTRS
jgi:hypothetical protein